MGRPAVPAADHEQPAARRRVAVVGRVQRVPADAVAETVDGVHPRVERLPVPRRLAVLVDRSPRLELGNVLDEDRVRLGLLDPVDDVPRARPLLLVHRLPAASGREVRTLRPRDEDVHVVVSDDRWRMQLLDLRVVVLGPRVIPLVRLDRLRPVVDGDQASVALQLLARQREPGREASPAAEEVDRGELITRHLRSPHERGGGTSR